MSKPELRVVIRRVADGKNDCLVRRAVVERLAPYGRWRPIRDDEDPQTAHDLDVRAADIAATWADRPGDGYAMWDMERSVPVWVVSYVEGELWIDIPVGRC